MIKLPVNGALQELVSRLSCYTADLLIGVQTQDLTNNDHATVGQLDYDVNGVISPARRKGIIVELVVSEGETADASRKYPNTPPQGEEFS